MYKIEYYSYSFPLWKPNFLLLYPKFTTELLLLIKILGRRNNLSPDLITKISYLVLIHKNNIIGSFHEQKHF